MTTASLDKFKGCLVGAVIGDCLGAPVECQWWGGIPAEKVEKRFEDYFNHGSNSRLFKYTDDTAMARQVALSLIEGKGTLDIPDLANKFQSEFYFESSRGYGQSVVEVFQKLKNLIEKSKEGNETLTEESCLQPAKEQFGGSGSFGNGAAMRVHPVALAASHLKETKVLASRQAHLTHSHPDAVDGATLQAAAVHFALTNTDTTSTSRNEFLKALRQLFPDSATYDLEDMQELLERSSAGTITLKELVEALGNDVSAAKSVPAAIFAFLKEFSASSNNPNADDSQNQSPFVRTLKTAMTFGGDTDTICSMAGAIAGAMYGRSGIPDQLAEICEGVKDAEEQAEKLHQIATVRTSGGNQ